MPVPIDIVFLSGTQKYKDELKHIVEIKAKKKSSIFKINNIKVIDFTYDEYGFSKPNLISVLQEHSIHDTTICFIDCPLEGNYFRRSLYENVSCVTFFQIRDICKEANVSVKNYVLRHLYKTAIRKLLNCDTNNKVINLRSHQRTKGCIYDFCGDDKYHVVLGFNKICHECETKLKKAYLPKNFVSLLKKELSQLENNNEGAFSMLGFNFENVSVDENLVFVLMPFTEPWSEYIWREQIKKIVEDVDGYSLVCRRADDLYGRDVMHDIINNIMRARIIIADITNRNPNVFYELGIAHAFNKDFVLLTQNVEHIPFDLNRYRHCIYSHNGPGYDILKNGLTESIKAILSSNASENIVTIHNTENFSEKLHRDASSIIQEIAEHIKNLTVFNSNPEALNYIGQTLLEVDLFVKTSDFVSIEDKAIIKALIGEILDEASEDGRLEMGALEPYFNLPKIRKLVDILLTYR